MVGTTDVTPLAVHICTGGRTLRTNLAAFLSKERADSWAASANIWYGKDHPLYPVQVEALALNQDEFPAEAMERLQSLPDDATSEERDAALSAIFQDIDR